MLRRPHGTAPAPVRSVPAAAGGRAAGRAAPRFIALAGAVLLAVACGGDTTGSQSLSAGPAEATDTVVPQPEEGGEVIPPEPTPDAASPTGGPDSTVTSAPLEPGEPLDPNRRNILVPDPSLVDLTPTRWESAVAEPEPQGRRVVVRFTVSGPPCQLLGGVDVDDTPEAVTITLLTGAQPGVDCSGPRIAIAMPAETVVTLPGPLVERPVRDGAGG